MILPQTSNPVYFHRCESFAIFARFRLSYAVKMAEFCKTQN